MTMKRKSSKTLLCFENINYGSSSFSEEDDEAEKSSTSSSSVEDDFSSPCPLRKTQSHLALPKDAPVGLARKFSEMFKTDSKEKFITCSNSEKSGRKFPARMSLWQPLVATGAFDRGIKKKMIFQSERDSLEMKVIG